MARAFHPRPMTESAQGPDADGSMITPWPSCATTSDVKASKSPASEAGRTSSSPLTAEGAATPLTGRDSGWNRFALS